MAGKFAYDDGRCVLDEDGLTLRRYYFPVVTSKRIPYSKIQKFDARPMGCFSGKGRGWGTSNPRYWLPLDMTRPRKNTLIVLDLGRRVKPVLRPDQPERVLQLLQERVPSR
jgi:hypothetical protein